MGEPTPQDTLDGLLGRLGRRARGLLAAQGLAGLVVGLAAAGVGAAAVLSVLGSQGWALAVAVAGGVGGLVALAVRLGGRGFREATVRVVQARRVEAARPRLRGALLPPFNSRMN